MSENGNAAVGSENTNPTLGAYAREVLAGLNKSDAEKAAERVNVLVENYIIETEMQISTLKTGKLPHLNNEIRRAKESIKNAKKAEEKAMLDILGSSSYEDFIGRVNEKSLAIDEAKERIEALEAKKVTHEAEIAKYESILEKFKAA